MKDINCKFTLQSIPSAFDQSVMTDQERIQDSPVGGGAKPMGRGCQHTNLPDFPKNCMKLKKFWSGGGEGASLTSLGSATADSLKFLKFTLALLLPVQNIV